MDRLCPVRTTALRPRLLRRCLRTLFRLSLAVWCWAAAGAWAGAPLLLPADAAGPIDAWPAVRVLGNPGGMLDAEGALRRLAQFEAPDGPHANLGPRRDVVWVQVPLQAIGGDGRWLLHIDYPPLNRVDLVLLRGGQVVARHLLGNAIANADRPMRSRGHAVELQLQPDVPHLLLLRVATQSAVLLPITLSRPADYHAREAGAQ